MASCLRHFSHHHELVKTKISASVQISCDICKTQIKEGPHYRCHECNFHLHEDCAMLPETIPLFFAHPWHNLHLRPGGKDGRICDLCRVGGTCFFYRCISCGFDVHPLCTTTKQIVCTGLHPEHTLFLLPTSPINSCIACKESGDSIWLYRCGICNVNLHMKCLNGPIKPQVSHMQCQPPYAMPAWSNNSNSNANNNSSGQGSSTIGSLAHQIAMAIASQTIANSVTDILFN